MGLVAFLGMVEKGRIRVDGILRLLVYLELDAMVGITSKYLQRDTSVARGHSGLTVRLIQVSRGIGGPQ